MSKPDDLPTLKQDNQVEEPLRRVLYEAGMMLGLEATRDEQAYHRRRLTRHQYWLHGYGTLAGLLVGMDPSSHANDTEDILVRLHVNPGIAIDGLGREILVHETYCINLSQWLEVQSEANLLEGFDSGSNLLWLKVTVRQKDCLLAKQPVLAKKLNISTDAVQPSRSADSVQLELIPELPPAADERYSPWAGHSPIADTLPGLNDAEQLLLDDLEVSNPAAAAQLSLHAKLLHALDENSIATQNLADELEVGARLLLARLSISTNDVNTITVNPELISINNLVRPFLSTASQLAWLNRQ
ncbi:MAG: hypothetical protein QNJ17_00520 [Desulfocapsaceae bacterium]|nr:hypothetical protein [Desulfocapsaceae bacterium]